MSDAREIVERLRSMSTDHGPDGWPAVQMRDITALCAEITRLRAEAASWEQQASDRIDDALRFAAERDALREAAQQALVALVHHTDQTRPIQRTADAIAVLRAALSAPPPAVPVSLAKSMERGCEDPRICAYYRQCMGECHQPLTDAARAAKLRATDAAAAPQAPTQPDTGADQPHPQR